MITLKAFHALFGVLAWNCIKRIHVSYDFRLAAQKLELCVSWEKPTLLRENGVELSWMNRWERMMEPLLEQGQSVIREQPP